MSDAAAWRASAALIGRLLVREVDAEALAAMREPDVARGLQEIGVAVPAGEDAGVLEALAVEYYDALVAGPRAVCPVQSIHESGAYEAEAAESIREIARAAGLDFDRSLARGAPHDHLGSIFLLWSALSESWPEGADHVARSHLGWAGRALAPLASRPTFYGSLAAAAVELADALRED